MENINTNDRKIGYICIAVTTILFSSMETVLKLVAGDFNPVQMTLIRFFIGGLVLFFAFKQWLILVLCGVTVILMAAAIVVYIALARKGYREEFVKRNTREWKFTFYEEEFSVETLEENGEKPYTEKFSYDRVERVALRKDRVYIYCGAALAYYIRYDNMTTGTFIDFCEFVKKKIEPAKFKMK